MLENVSLDSSLMTEEIFGPLLPVITFTTTEQAMSIVQRNENPLAFYLFTTNEQTEKEWIEKNTFWRWLHKQC